MELPAFAPALASALGSPVYVGLSVVALALSAFFWKRRMRDNPALPLVFFGGLVGAYAGAKLCFLLCEGWAHWSAEDRWLLLLSGKTITGALLGGYAGVELTKRAIGYRAATGDFFAFAVPASIVLGRIGCMTQGCCPGHECAPDAWYAVLDAHGAARWPAALVEGLFNLGILAVLFALRARPALRGQLFHVYLVSYGIFRFAHEFVRETPRIDATGLSGYQLAALALVVLGLERFAKRRAMHTRETPAQGSRTHSLR